MKKNIQWGIAVCHFTLIKRVTHKIRIELFFKLVQIVQVQYYLISMCMSIEQFCLNVVHFQTNNKFPALVKMVMLVVGQIPHVWLLQVLHISICVPTIWRQPAKRRIVHSPINQRNQEANTPLRNDDQTHPSYL